MLYFSDVVLYCFFRFLYADPDRKPSGFGSRPSGLDKTMKRVIAFVLLIVLVPAIALADLEVHFLDVGQGDCAVVLCDGEAMVIDGGPRASSGTVYRYIREELGLRHVDYVVSTHPHVDHVYGLSSVLNAARADLVLTPVTQWDSKAFEYVMKYAARQGAPVSVPSEGDTLRLGGALVTVLHCWPEAVDLGRTNDSSIVLRVDYGKVSFLFTGDAEDWSEYMMLDAGANVRADVLKVSHHGSNTASTREFLQAVQPAYAVISVGKDNGYGHPHREVLARLAEIGAETLRTDEVGTVRMRSDGTEITVY